MVNRPLVRLFPENVKALFLPQLIRLLDRDATGDLGELVREEPLVNGTHDVVRHPRKIVAIEVPESKQLSLTLIDAAGERDFGRKRGVFL